MGDDMQAGLDANWAAWLAATARHVDGAETRQFGSVAATSVGVAMPLFNQAFVFDDPVVDDVAAAAEWLRERGAPFWVTSPGHLKAAVAEHAEQIGLSSETGSLPGMVLRSLAGLSSEMPSDLELVSVTDPEQFEIVVTATVDAFGVPLELARRLASPSMLDDAAMQWFVGLVDGEPAACGQLLLTDGIAGVYTIAVIERFRRRGFGEAVTRAVLLAGRERGATCGVLQASPMGKPVYERMGFEVFTDYALHADAN